MLADEVDVDTHRDQHTLAVIVAPAGAVLAQTVVGADTRGYTAALRFADKHAPGVRAWAVEGAGHYGAGLTRYLAERGETALEVGRHAPSERRLRGKDDPLDAIQPHAQDSPRRCWPCRAPGSGRRPCGCCCSQGAAQSTRVGTRSSSFAA